MQRSKGLVSALLPCVERLVVFLDRLDAQALGFHGADAVEAGFRAGEGGHDGNPVGHGGAADFHFVLARDFAARGVDDEMDEFGSGLKVPSGKVKILSDDPLIDEDPLFDINDKETTDDQYGGFGSFGNDDGFGDDFGDGYSDDY